MTQVGRVAVTGAVTRGVPSRDASGGTAVWRRAPLRRCAVGRRAFMTASRTSPAAFATHALLVSVPWGRKRDPAGFVHFSCCLRRPLYSQRNLRCPRHRGGGRHAASRHRGLGALVSMRVVRHLLHHSPLWAARLHVGKKRPVPVYSETALRWHLEVEREEQRVVKQFTRASNQRCSLHGGVRCAPKTRWRQHRADLAERVAWRASVSLPTQ